MLPFFDGERVPALPHASASLHGMTAANLSRANLCRAVLEGTAFACATARPAARQRPAGRGKSAWSAARRRTRCGGGRSPTCSACRWSVRGRPRPPPLGAALQAAWSLGRESGAGESLEALCRRCVALDESTRTQPQARQQAAYEQAYRRYLEHLPPR